MVVSGKHRLSVDVMDQVTECVKFKVEQEEDKRQNRNKKRKVLMLKVETAKALDKSAWTTDNYKAMVQHYKHQEDPRMAKDIAGLRTQWVQRRGRSSSKHSNVNDPHPYNEAFPPLKQQELDDDVLLGLDDHDAENDTPDGQLNLI